ncbi:MAG TPA: PA14 domain-containing protein, partial [Candidatus Acidoferrum sp.]|nr:PA14 domain-containing protein [Candidatus Acidoferrum sp.]
GVRYNVKSQADPFEIYNATVDLQETNDLALQMPALQQRMKAASLQVRRPNPTAPRPFDNELVPALDAAPHANGVEWKAYEGDYPWVPDLEALKPVRSGTAERPDPGKRTRDDNIGLLFSGCLSVPRDGDYTFYLQADTGALLRLHDATVIDADFGYVGGQEASGLIKLQAGLHPFRLFYARRTGGKPALQLSWSGPGIAKEIIPNDVFQRMAASPGAPK